MHRKSKTLSPQPPFSQILTSPDASTLEFYAALFFKQGPLEKFQVFFSFQETENNDKQAKLPLIRTIVTTWNADPVPWQKWQEPWPLPRKWSNEHIKSWGPDQTELVATASQKIMNLGQFIPMKAVCPWSSRSFFQKRSNLFFLESACSASLCFLNSPSTQ